MVKNYVKALLAVTAALPAVLFAQSTTTASTMTSTSASTSTSSQCSLMNPQTFAQNAVNHVLGILQTDQSEINTNFAAVQNDIQTALSPLIGITIMAQYVVPPTIWSAASSADQSAFEAAFLQFIIGLYSSPLKNFSSQTVQVYPSRVAWNTQQRVQINSVIQNPKAGPQGDIPVSFILQQNNCEWLFIDFVVDNISALANIQSQIQSILQNMKTPNLSDLTQVIVQHNASTSS